MVSWIPAFAGMTIRGVVQSSQGARDKDKGERLKTEGEEGERNKVQGSR